MKTFRLFLFAALALLAALSLPLPARAQGQPPVVEPIFFQSPLRLDLHSVDAVVDGPVATVRVQQLYRNDSRQDAEGSFIFPLPAGAAVGDFQMTVDGHVLEGQVLDKEQARRVYEDIVRRRRDPALLEYVGRDLFQTSVFPIPAGASRKLEFSYTYTLPLEDGLYHFRYPLSLQQRGLPVKTLSLRIELRNQPGLRTIYSPTHVISIDRQGDDGAVIGYEGSGNMIGGDFELFYGVSPEAIGLNLLSYKPATEDGYFLLLAAPSLEVAPDAVIKRDIILVLDVSGSMEGAKIAQAKQAARYVVDHLNPEDRFNIIAFSTATRLWAESLQPYNQESLAAAQRWLDKMPASGSTDINRALLEAMAQLQTSDTARPAYVLFLTDGLPTLGETQAGRIITNILNNRPSQRSIHLFSFGVGYDVDTDLLNDLSDELGGRSMYVKPDQRIDEVVSTFYEQISTPVLTNVDITFPGLQIEESYPYPIPDLFAGQQIVWVGRYRQGGDVAVELRGKVNGEERLFRYEGQHLATTGGDSQVARLWASRKIGALLDAIRRQGAQPELVDAVVDLSTRYGIVTPYTSYLVLEPTMQPVTGMNRPPVPAAPKEVQVTVEVEEVVEMPASGEAAVAGSEARRTLRESSQVADTADVRYIAGKAFTRQGALVTAEGGSVSLWVDNSYRQDMPRKTVRFASDEYFAMAADPTVAAWLALSPEMVVVIDGTAYRITLGNAGEQPDWPPAPGTAPTPTPTPTPPAQTPPVPSLWQMFLDWLRRLLGGG